MARVGRCQANLREADLTDTNFADANLRHVDFTDATVTGAYFDNYDKLAQDATLNGVDFQHARFGSAT
jgi:uncharacterized protein YjbI with pentapeptide repeats